LAAYALSEEGTGIPPELDLFKVFSENAEKVIAARENIPPEDIVAIEVFFTRASLYSRFRCEIIYRLNKFFELC
jgi:hypothetical protein